MCYTERRRLYLQETQQEPHRRATTDTLETHKKVRRKFYESIDD